MEEIVKDAWDIDTPFEEVKESIQLSAPNAQETLKLSEEQQIKILTMWNENADNPPSLKEIINVIFGQGFDGRSLQGKLIKEFLTSRKLKARAAHEYISKKYELNENEREFIVNHATTMKPLEIARELFNNNQLQALDAKARAAIEYYNSLDDKLKIPQVNSEEVKDLPKEFRPPKTQDQAIFRVNKYVLDGIDTKKDLTQKIKNCIHSLIRFMHVHRFIYLMNEITTEKDRELFESSFVRFIWDKPDLTEEELDLYLSYCTDIVAHAKLQREIEELIAERGRILDETGKMPMPIVESIGKLMNELDNNAKRQKNLLNDLNGKRSERIEKLGKDRASILDLVELWKEEEKRKRIVLLAEAKKKKLENAWEELANMDDLKFQMWGLSKNEALHWD